MGVQASVSMRNASLDAYETASGAAPKLQIRTGGQPASCAAASTGTKLCEITLPPDFMTPAVNGQKSKNGTWTGSATAAGTAAHFRLLKSDGSECLLQGRVTVDGGGGDLTIDNVSVASGQVVTVTDFDWIAALA